MEIIYLVFGAILGGTISWIISLYFYRRSSKDLGNKLERLIPETKEILIENLKNKPEDIDLTARQIVNLYKNKVFDLESSDPLPFNHCPKCGSDKLKRSSFTDEKRDDNYYSIECGECGWSDWTQ